MQMTVSGEHRSLHREEPGGSISPEFRAEFAVLCHTHGGGGGSVCASLPPLSFWHLRIPFVSMHKIRFPLLAASPSAWGCAGLAPPPPPSPTLFLQKIIIIKKKK